MLKNKFFLVFLALLLINIGFFAFVAAKDLEVEYPVVPGAVQTPNSTRTLLPVYIDYVVRFIIVFSGVVVFGAFLAGAFQFFTSAANPSALSDAKNRMSSAFLGLIVILSSYLILNTINPKLIELKIGDLSFLGKVTFLDPDNPRDEFKQYKTTGNVPNFDDLNMAPHSVEISANLVGTVEVVPCHNKNDFTMANCETYYPAGIIKGASGSFPSDAKAAKLIWKIPGVYLYDEASGKGQLRIYTGDTGSLGDFDNKTTSVFIQQPPPPVSGERNVYAAVLHSEEGFRGKCEFITWTGGIHNINLNNDVSSITVLKLRVSSTGSPVNFGGYTRAYFYSEPNFESKIDESGNTSGNWVTFSPENSLYSIRMEGTPFVAVAENQNGGGRCDVFRSNDSDLNDNPIGQCTVVGTCTPGCPNVFGWCPVCTASCASSYLVLPLGWK